MAADTGSYALASDTAGPGVDSWVSWVWLASKLAGNSCHSADADMPATGNAAADAGVEVVAMVRCCGALLLLLMFFGVADAVQNCGAAGWKNMDHCGGLAADGAVVAEASAASMAVAASMAAQASVCTVAISRLNGVVTSTWASWKNMPHCGTVCLGETIAAVVDIAAAATFSEEEEVAAVSLSRSRVGVCVTSLWMERAPEGPPCPVVGPLRIGVHDVESDNGVAVCVACADSAAKPLDVAVLLLFTIGVQDDGVVPAPAPHGGRRTGRAAFMAARAAVVAAERDIVVVVFLFAFL